ncbi:MAG: zinc ABC transporter substrate-binding protein [Gammaproteobacteria bacterium]|tara:strand:- start:26073 stop:26975 length:903 start_codon:yes stop_codon:yes gene_type:complete
MTKKAIIFIFSFFLSTSAFSSEIVASVKPLHSLVSAVTQGAHTVSLLIEGSMSPHNFALKPSHAKLLNNAKVVFYIDNQLESALKRTVIGLPTSIRVVTVSKTKQLNLLPARSGGNWEEDGHDHHHHDHGSNDVHFWLEPSNAIQIVKGIVRELSIVYPKNINLYKKNAKNIIKEIKSTDLSIKSMLVPIKDKPYIVFHDAYQYFEKAYGLNAVGSIMLDPELPPSAKRIIQIRTKIKSTNASCVFKEPQFRAKIVNTVIEDTNAQVGTLDPLGADLASGPNMYLELLKSIASNLKTCLQ